MKKIFILLALFILSGCSSPPSEKEIVNQLGILDVYDSVNKIVIRYDMTKTEFEKLIGHTITLGENPPTLEEDTDNPDVKTSGYYTYEDTLAIIFRNGKIKGFVIAANFGALKKQYRNQEKAPDGIKPIEMYNPRIKFKGGLCITSPEKQIKISWGIPISYHNIGDSFDYRYIFIKNENGY